MPIRTAIPIQVFDQERFHQIDRRVTGIAFDIHNEFGRYLDERIDRLVNAIAAMANGRANQPPG